MVVVLALVGCSKKSDDPKQTATPVEQAKIVVGKGDPKIASKDEAKLERGSYLVKVTGCLVCHTAAGPTGPDYEHLGAGGLEMPDPLGAWRTPNITPDKATGIGGWTDDQITRSIREGTRPDGTQLYAIMPFAMYNRMTDEDASAIVAYLHTLKPVERVVAPNKNLKFPQPVLPKPANTPDVTGDPLAHGEYLATLMLCGHCHATPIDGPPTPDHMFTGGLDLTIPAMGKGKLYAPNITSDKDTGIGAYTEDQLFTTLKTMVRPNGKMIAPPMLMMQAGWCQITDADMHAVAKYVHQIPAVKHKVTASTFEFQPGGPPAK
jgi:cytochrome c553